MSRLITKCIADIQYQLDKAAVDTNRCVHDAEYSGNTKNLVQNIDNRYKLLAKFINGSVTSLNVNKRAALKSAEYQLGATIVNRNSANSIFHQLDSTVNEAIDECNVQVIGYIKAIQINYAQRCN